MHLHFYSASNYIIFMESGNLSETRGFGVQIIKLNSFQLLKKYSIFVVWITFVILIRAKNCHESKILPYCHCHLDLAFDGCSSLCNFFWTSKTPKKISFLKSFEIHFKIQICRICKQNQLIGMILRNSLNLVIIKSKPFVLIVS